MFKLFRRRPAPAADPGNPELLRKAEAIEPLLYRAVHANAEKFGFPVTVLDAKRYFSPNPGFPEGVYCWLFRLGEPGGMLLLPRSLEIAFHAEPGFFKLIIRAEDLARLFPVPDGWYSVPSNQNEMRVRFEEADTFLRIIIDIHNVIEAMLRVLG